MIQDLSNDEPDKISTLESLQPISSYKKCNTFYKVLILASDMGAASITSTLQQTITDIELLRTPLNNVFIINLIILNTQTPDKAPSAIHHIVTLLQVTTLVRPRIVSFPHPKNTIVVALVP